jgi:deoxyribose-phosphate aldolase
VIGDTAAAQIALRCLDLTSLNDGDDARAIDTLCAKARTRFGNVAAVCVWPRFVAQARAALPPGIAVAAVANFPAGALDERLALADTQAIVEAGGDEIDLVLPWRAMLQGPAKEAARLVARVRAACPTHTLKLIIESGELPSTDAVLQACRIGLEAGVDYLKTSTGKTAHGASLDAARTMLGAIAAQSRPVGFKASGGVRTVAGAAGYAALVAEALGQAALCSQRLRFGASGLLGDIERVLSGGEGAAAAHQRGGY